MNSWGKYLKEQNDLLLSNNEINDKLEHLSQSIFRKSEEVNSVVFTAGNGGSATTADHFAADLSLSRKRSGKLLRSICLNAHLGLNTALSNDISYEESLSSQLENYLDGPSTVVVFSASGNSKNIVRVLEVASSAKIECWAFLGFDGGEAIKLTGVNSVLFPDKLRDYGRLENAHLMAAHFVVDRVLSLLKGNI